ncbi:MAG: hypothetical protein HXY45_17365 [Syntrophaceae bacterium]|nr:hypothetical protein [Syntrophaceae bacterium]
MSGPGKTIRQGTGASGKSWGKPFSRGDFPILEVFLVTIPAIAFFSQRLPDFFKTLSLVWGILLGTLPVGILGRLFFSVRPEVQWLSFPPPLLPESPRFSPSAILPFRVAYLAVVINGVGNMYSIGEIVGKERIGRAGARGIGVTGVGGILAGVLGSIGMVSFSISPGVVLIIRGWAVAFP